MPLQTLVLEKLNYHLLQVGFKITGWHLEFNEVDYRDSEVIEKIRDMRIRNGLYVLNRARDEINEPPVEAATRPSSSSGRTSPAGGTLKPHRRQASHRSSEAPPWSRVARSRVQAVQVEKPEPAPTPPQLLPFTGQAPPPDGITPDGSDQEGPADKALPDKDRDGGPDAATPGRPPRENRYAHDFRRLSESWEATYRARRKMALEGLPTVGEDPPVPDRLTQGPPLPVDPYWDADQHTHNDRPDYTPQDLGLPTLERVIVDPRDTGVDHSYQRPRQAGLVRHYADEPRQRLAARVGLLALRPDGSMWVVDGQHHTAAAIQVGLTELTYQQFLSTGPVMEARVYAALHHWHTAVHKQERAKAVRPGKKTKVKGLPLDHVVNTLN
jgi:hypothetical protein